MPVIVVDEQQLPADPLLPQLLVFLVQGPLRVLGPAERAPEFRPRIWRTLQRDLEGIQALANRAHQDPFLL